MFEKQKGQTITPQNMGSLTCLANRYGEETGDRAYGFYPRILECPTICRCNSKGNTFSPVILRVLVRPGA